MVAKFRKPEEEELDMEDESPDPVGAEDTDSDEETPRPKLVKKAKKVKAAEEEAPKKVAKKKVKATAEKAPKKVAKAKKEKVKKARAPRKTIFTETGEPYGEESMVGRAFAMARKGVAIEKLKAFIDKEKETKKGGSWVITRLRSGHRGDGKVVWKVIDPGTESGTLKIGPPRPAEAVAA